MSSPEISGGHAPVAIVGMGCRFPGGVEDAPGLWQLLRNNRDGWKEFDEPRFSRKAFYHSNQDRPGSMRTKGGFLVDSDARLFDHGFFGITGREVETMDPSQRKLLEVVYEAFENAGETWESISGTNTGVFIGMFALDHVLIQSRDWDYTKPYAATGAETSILANRMSYVFNLHGPSLAINTACSSSMYALHLAVNAIRNGDCDRAIVAAANWISDPSMNIVLDKLGALSPTSRCHTFDAAADGYARGEGFAALYLKRSSLAIREHTPIRAMIRGTAANANGKTGGITRPSAIGQEAVIRKAYENAGNLALEDTTFFECHGTGTPAGDPLEVAAVGAVFAASRISNAPEDRLLIGSIKPNLGHTEGTSAIASIMKVILAIEAGEIPPTHGVQRLNPNIDFDGAKVRVVTGTTEPWPTGKMRRASVNSFGFGGANGHCIIDHVNVVIPDYVHLGAAEPTRGAANGHTANGYTTGFNGNAYAKGARTKDGIRSLVELRHCPVLSPPVKKSHPQASTPSLVLLPFSAHAVTSLQANIDILAKVIHQWNLADVTYTLACKRSRLQHRTFRVVNKHDVYSGMAISQPVVASPIQKTNVAFIFTGQGAQWHAMGKELFQYSVFRSTISYLDLVVRSLPDPPSWSISQILSGDCESGQIQVPNTSQLACTAVQMALVDLLAAWSVRPVAVVGHSSGEMAAAYASGHTTAAEAIAAALYRGKAVSRNTRKGAMLAVGLGPEDVASFIEDRDAQVRIAAINSPASVTLSGDEDAITAVSANLTKREVFNRLLRTSGSAYHSHHMASLGDQYSEELTRGVELLKKLGLVDVAHRYARVPWLSSVTPGKVMTASSVPPSYWRSNLESPVRFAQALVEMMRPENGLSIEGLIEVGPHPALKGPVDQTLRSIDKTTQYFASLQRDQDSQEMMLKLAGSLFGANAEIDLAMVNAVDDGHVHGSELSMIHGVTAVDLPTYQYTYGPMIYFESRASKEYRLRQYLRHELLGSEVLGSSRLQPQWRNVLRIKDLPWLSDHRLEPDVVFPGAGYVAMAMEAITRAYRNNVSESLEVKGYSFRDVDIITALRIPEDDYGVEVVLAMDLRDTATAKSTAWARFTISSVDRADPAKWLRHCAGFVKAETVELTPEDEWKTLIDPRFPDEQDWYARLAEIGLSYGKTFQPLSRLQSDPDRNIAKAMVALDSATGSVSGEETVYPIHPAALDAAFQLAIIAIYGGQTESASAAFVPVQISHLYLRNGTSGQSCSAVACGQVQDQRSATAQIQMLDQRGKVFVQIEQMRFLAFRDSQQSVTGASKHSFCGPYTRMVWKPDFRSLTNDQARALFPPPPQNAAGAQSMELVDMICCLVVADIHEVFATGTNEPQPKGHIRHWFDWIKRCVNSDPRPNMSRASKLSTDERRKMLQDLYDEAGNKPEAQAARLLHENAADILHERKEGIDILISNKLLTPLYEVGHAIAGSHPQVTKIMDIIAHADPNCSILEIGAGTGSATRAAMTALCDQNGNKRYKDYTFTDISPGFLTYAKEMLAEYRDVKFSILDIEKDPMENGYEPVYDVVLACEAIHATQSMEKTLSHCRSLLKPGGKMVLVETTRMRVLLGLLYGTLTGFWQPDERSEGPFMELPIWERRLTSNGFTAPQLVVDDYEAPHNTTSVLVTTRVEKEEAEVASRELNEQVEPTRYLIHDTLEAPAFLGQVSAEFEDRGIACRTCSLNEAPDHVPHNASTFAFLESIEMDEQRLRALQYLACSSQSMVCVTRGGMLKGNDPDGAFMPGLLRVIATENPAGRFTSFNIEAADLETQESDLVTAIVEYELSSQNAAGTSNHREFTWQDRCMWTSRVVPDIALGVYSEMHTKPARQGFEYVPIGSRQPLCAAFETAGVLSSLYFHHDIDLLPDIPADFIDVKIAAIGLSPSDAVGRSSEYAGIVTRVGAEVNSISVGDHVFGLGRGRFGTFARVPEALSYKLDKAADMMEAATMPWSYATAVYAFDYASRLRKDQTVLVQAATDAMSLASIQFALDRGAEVFAAVESPDDVYLLTEYTGLPSSRILCSAAAMAAAAKSSRKEGFHVIFTPAGADSTQHDSLKHLLPTGHHICVRRWNGSDSTDNTDSKKVNSSSFDLYAILDYDRELGGDLMQAVGDLWAMKRIGPIRPSIVSDVADLAQTLAGFSKATPLGKPVISYRDGNSVVKTLLQPEMASFSADARYVITGGLGGLGRSIIRWMAKRGACEFIVLSRRGPSTPAARLLLRDAASQGLRIHTVKCDIGNKGEVLKALGSFNADERPIRGIINAALSLSDLTFDKLNLEQWQSGTAAKMAGIRNLHEATATAPLDFFVMLTSTETVWAPPSQASYIAATNFQEYFARYRRRLGLPATFISLGFVRDVGSDFRETAHGTAAMYTRNQALTMTEHEVLAALEAGIVHGSVREIDWVGKAGDPLSAAGFFTCLDPLRLAASFPVTDARWTGDERAAFVLRMVDDARRHVLASADATVGGDDKVMSAPLRVRAAFDEAVKAGAGNRTATTELVVGAIAGAIASMLFIDQANIMTDKSVAGHGVDSLVAAELRHWFLKALNVSMKMGDLLDAQISIAGLAEQIVGDALQNEV